MDAMMANMSYLDSLDKEQRTAVTAPTKPTKVVAGAGSGKTRVLTCRVAHQVLTDQADPETMFVSAFTKAAAEQMGERVLDLVPSANLTVATFHSLMFRLLNDELMHKELPRYGICKDYERKKIIEGYLGRPSKDYPEGINCDADIAVVNGYFSTWKNMLVGPTDPGIAETLEEAPEGSDMYAAATIYPLYENHLYQLHKIDFDDMLIKAYELISRDNGALQRARQRWQSFFLDEAQDTNHAQWELVKLLADPDSSPNITIVGDQRQSIYGFRGALPELMERFEEMYKGANVLVLKNNYRSVPAIVARSNQLIKKQRLPDQVAVRKGTIEPFAVEVLDVQEQATDIAQFVIEAKDQGIKGGDIAVLIRTNAQSVEIENAFVAARLPYWCRSGGFFDRLEIGDMMAYIRLAADRTNREYLDRIINKPTRYLGRAFVDAVVKTARNHDGDLVKALRYTKSYSTKKMFPKQLDSAKDLADLIESISPTDGSFIAPAAAINKVLKETEYLDWLRKTTGGSEGLDDSRKDNIDALLAIAQRYGSIKSLIQFADDATQLQMQTRDATEISTVHRAKGQEWPVVICSNMHDNSFPHIMAQLDGSVEDERRVCYVAFTRAQDLLIAMYPRINEKLVVSDPSRYIEDSGILFTEEEDWIKLSVHELVNQT